MGEVIACDRSGLLLTVATSATACVPLLLLLLLLMLLMMMMMMHLAQIGWAQTSAPALGARAAAHRGCR